MALKFFSGYSTLLFQGRKSLSINLLQQGCSSLCNKTVIRSKTTLPKKIIRNKGKLPKFSNKPDFSGLKFKADDPENPINTTKTKGLGTGEDTIPFKKRRKKVFSKREKIARREAEAARKRALPIDIKEVNSAENLASLLEIDLDYLKELAQDLSEKPLIGDVVPGELAKEIVISLDRKVKIDPKVHLIEADEKNLEKRPPVVTIMGHVDHGKTTLLDTLRHAHVADGEAGGITQHIGAFQVKTENGDIVSFIDTPGHAAFSEMRRHGAQVTDVIILVVAADDGVQPQTLEVLEHAKVNRVPFIIALNKIDSPQANLEKSKQSLISAGVELEEFGGEIQCIEISGKLGTNLNELVDSVLLQSEMMELKANPKSFVEGVIFESKTQAGLGCVCSMLVKNGTLKIGQILVADDNICKVKGMRNWSGQQVKTAYPSDAVEVIGFRSLPDPGAVVRMVDSEAQGNRVIKARKRIVEKRVMEHFGGNAKRSDRIEMEEEIEIEEDEKCLNLIVKGDVNGTVDALKSSLLSMKNEFVHTNILRCAVGSVTTSDCELAKLSGATIIAFNVKVEKDAMALAGKKNSGVVIEKSKIIYQLLDSVAAKLQALMPEREKQTFIGRGKVKQIFTLNQKGANCVAGSTISDGKFQSDGLFRIIRKKHVIFETHIVEDGLKHFKDSVSLVNSGQECGLLFNMEKINDELQDNSVEELEPVEILPGDVVECYTTEILKETFKSPFQTKK